VTGLYWIIAVVILQAIVAGIAKKAQEKRAMQSKGGVPPASQTPAKQPTKAPAARQVVRGSSAVSTTPAAPRAVSPVPQLNSQSQAGRQSQSDLARARATADAQQRARAQAQARAQAEAQAKARAQAQARAQADAQARMRAQAKAQAQARAQVAQQRAAANPSALQRAVGRAQSEERDALHSRERVQQSLERVRAAERKVADALPGHEAHAADAPKKPSVASGLRAMLSDRNRIREAFVLSEVLGTPRSMTPSAGFPIGLR
jgi:hypothetical protein